MERKTIRSLFVLAIMGLSLTAITVTSHASSTCPSGAICRTDEAPGSYSGNGPYSTSSYSLTTYSAGATVYYPTSSAAQAPYSVIVFCPPYMSARSASAAWGTFFASHGIVFVNTDTTTTMDTVDSRATQQANAVSKIKGENTRTGSVLKGKIATDRIGLMGWSMGGGATWINSATSGFKSALSLAGHNLTSFNANVWGDNTKCPILVMHGAMDTTYLGGMGQSEGVYSSIPRGVPKVEYQVLTAGHMVWGGPTTAGASVGAIALAFQKTFLDGDTRWVSYISRPLDASIWYTANLPQ